MRKANSWTQRCLLSCVFTFSTSLMSFTDVHITQHSVLRLVAFVVTGKSFDSFRRSVINLSFWQLKHTLLYYSAVQINIYLSIYFFGDLSKNWWPLFWGWQSHTIKITNMRLVFELQHHSGILTYTSNIIKFFFMLFMIHCIFTGHLIVSL